MPKALDPSLLLGAGRTPPAPAAQPPAQRAPAPEAPPPAAEPEAVTTPPTTARPARRAPARPRPRSRESSPIASTATPPRPVRAPGSRLQPVGVLLTADQVGWLYRVEGQAGAQRRRVSHSELLRFAIDRQRQDHAPREVAELLAGAAPPTEGEYGSYGLADDQVRWLREVKGHAFLAGSVLSQADVIRGAVQAVMDLSWRDLRDQLGRK